MTTLLPTRTPTGPTEALEAFTRRAASSPREAGDRFRDALDDARRSTDRSRPEPARTDGAARRDPDATTESPDAIDAPLDTAAVREREDASAERPANESADAEAPAERSPTGEHPAPPPVESETTAPRVVVTTPVDASAADAPTDAAPREGTAPAATTVATTPDTAASVAPAIPTPTTKAPESTADATAAADARSGDGARTAAPETAARTSTGDDAVADRPHPDAPATTTDPAPLRDPARVGVAANAAPSFEAAAVATRRAETSSPPAARPERAADAGARAAAPAPERPADPSAARILLDGRNEARRTAPAEARSAQVEAQLHAESIAGRQVASELRPVELPTAGLPTGSSLAGDERVATEARPLPTPRGEAVPQVMKAFSALVNQRGGTMTMRLAPAELGAVRIRLAVFQGVVDAQIVASSSRAHAMLERGLPSLRTALEGQGLSVERLAVHLAPSESGGRADAQGQQAHDHGRSDRSGAQHDAAGRQSQGRRDDDREPRDRARRDAFASFAAAAAGVDA